MLLWCWAQFMSSIFLRQTEELVWFMMSFVYVYWKMFCFRETFHPSQMYTSGKILHIDLRMLVMWQISDTAVSFVPRCQAADNIEYVGFGQPWAIHHFLLMICSARSWV